MARIMIVLASGRKNGYTASLFKTAICSIKNIDNVYLDVYPLHDYSFGPCTSCFRCIRKVGSGCTLKDAWGRDGIIYKAFRKANGLLIVDAVHTCGFSAMGKLFMERIYPAFWEGITYGLPFASISCASNQGFQQKAMEDYCRCASGHGFLYIGGNSVHTADFLDAKKNAVALSQKLVEAAIIDEKYGRNHLNDEEIFNLYTDTPWNCMREYLNNITNGTFSREGSILAIALRDGGFKRKGLREMLIIAYEHLEAALELYKKNEINAAAKETAIVAKYWTHATYKEYLEKDVIKAKIPRAYRPMQAMQETKQLHVCNPDQ